MELKIGNTYFVFNIGKNGKPYFVGLWYYVGCGKFSEEISPLFWRNPMEMKIAVPHDNGGLVKSAYNCSGNRVTEVNISPKCNLFDFRIDNKEITDIESDNLNEFDWWIEFVNEHTLKPQKPNKGTDSFNANCERYRAMMASMEGKSFEERKKMINDFRSGK